MSLLDQFPQVKQMYTTHYLDKQYKFQLESSELKALTETYLREVVYSKHWIYDFVSMKVIDLKYSNIDFKLKLKFLNTLYSDLHFRGKVKKTNMNEQVARTGKGRKKEEREKEGNEPNCQNRFCSIKCQSFHFLLLPSKSLFSFTSY